MCDAAALQPIPIDTLRPLIARVVEKWFELKGGARILPRAGFAPKDFAFALIIATQVHVEHLEQTSWA